ncbi:hypothetical protein PVAP13_5KG697150 [Panicum virgatum]|uniref:Uncharacterized protein n=1 Tax=Panicum virgatum TaxID=38727 RepID=A0A8T0T2J7_PANVG|nr:hypothetical protein PVAP13_5KG697150 [Panicum virgatum]
MGAREKSLVGEGSHAMPARPQPLCGRASKTRTTAWLSRSHGMGTQRWRPPEPPPASLLLPPSLLPMLPWKPLVLTTAAAGTWFSRCPKWKPVAALLHSSMLVSVSPHGEVVTVSEITGCSCDRTDSSTADKIVR